MRKGVLWLVAALAVVALLGERSMAQPPGRRGPRGGGRDGIERALDRLDLSGTNLDTARSAVRTYRDNVQRLTDLASAELVLKLKDVVSAEEFTTLRKAAETARTSTVRRGPGRSLGESDMVERIMSFDKNKDGKITKDELPERMQHLIAKGDANKDGVLDKDEVKKLAADLAREESSRGRGRGGRSGRGGFPGAADDSRLTLSAVERAVRGLNLLGKKKETAAAVVKGCQENARKLTELARADLLLRVSGLLSEEQLVKFKEALER